MYSVKILKAYATVRTQTIATNLTFVMMMILPAVGNVNFCSTIIAKNMEYTATSTATQHRRDSNRNAGKRFLVLLWRNNYMFKYIEEKTV